MAHSSSVKKSADLSPAGKSRSDPWRQSICSNLSTLLFVRHSTHSLRELGSTRTCTIVNSIRSLGIMHCHRRTTCIFFRYGLFHRDIFRGTILQTLVRLCDSSSAANGRSCRRTVAAHVLCDTSSPSTHPSRPCPELNISLHCRLGDARLTAVTQISRLEYSQQFHGAKPS